MSDCSAKDRIGWRRWRLTVARPLGVVTACVALAACADWPDDYDITNWSGEPKVEGEVPGADEDFPTLGSVPEPPENVSTLEEIEQIEQSLTSDLQNARHSSGNYRRAEEEVEFEPVPAPAPEVIEEEVEEDTGDDGFFDFLGFGGDGEPAESQTVETVTVVESVEVEEVETVTSQSGDLAAEEIVVEETVVADVVVEETVAEQVATDETMTEEVIVSQAVVDEPEPTNQSLVAQSERAANGGDLLDLLGGSGDQTSLESTAAAETAPASTTAVGDQTVVTESVATNAAADDMAASETIIGAGDPGIQVPVGSPDDALPPQALGRTITSELDVVSAPSMSEPMAAGPAVVDQTVEEGERVERDASSGGSGDMQQTFDAVFAESGTGAVSSGSGAATATANVADEPSPTITAGGFETLATIIRFNLGSTVLDDRDREIIRQLAAIYRERGGRMRLVGYASHDPGNKNAADETLVNFKISVDRATAVADELVRQGVPSGDIVVDAQGDQASVHLAQGQVDEAQQRRVDVYLTN